MRNWVLLGVACAMSSAVAAQPLAAQAPAAVAQHTERVAEAAPDATDAMLWDASAGAVLNTGNTRAFAGNLGTRFSIRRGDNQVGAELKFTYGQAAVRTMGQFGDWEENSNNLQGRVRYDRFFTAHDSLFAAVVGRRDHFAGLDLRLQGQVGYARDFLTETNHRLWAEAGYDGTYDNYDPDPLVDAMTMMELDGTAFIHSGRLFVGYDNHVNEALTFRTGLEALLDVEEPSNLRLNYDAELNAKLSGRLQLGLKFSAKFDNEPVSGTEELDTVTTLNLVYSLVSAD